MEVGVKVPEKLRVSIEEGFSRMSSLSDGLLQGDPLVMLLDGLTLDSDRVMLVFGVILRTLQAVTCKFLEKEDAYALMLWLLLSFDFGNEFSILGIEL